ncbi:MAG: hypothetical protein R3B47_13860 [Bacteroidia bacterium]
MYELGARYEYLDQLVLAISRSLPREIIRYTNHFHNVNTTGSLTYEAGKNGYYNRKPDGPPATRLSTSFIVLASTRG